MDDAFSFNPDEELAYYGPYDTYYPKKPSVLLHLFDEIGIPHKKRKQEYGQNLTIIGLWILLDSMSISMLDDKRENLVKEVLQFINEKTPSSSIVGMAAHPWLLQLGSECLSFAMPFFAVIICEDSWEEVNFH